MTKADDDHQTCFIIMPISDADGYPEGHFSEVLEGLIKPAIAEAGYKPRLATSTASAHMIQLEIITQIAKAPLCICDLSTNNPNVLFEYGLRQAFDLPTVLIRDNKTRRIFDLSGFRDIEYDHTLRFANLISAREKLSQAITDTVDGAKGGHEVFSLVRLMNLSAAAFPKGDIEPSEARFELLERKLDDMRTAMISSQQQLDFTSWMFDRKKATTLASINTDPYLEYNGKLIFDGAGGPIYIRNLAELNALPDFRRLSPDSKEWVLERVRASVKGFENPVGNA